MRIWISVAVSAAILAACEPGAQDGVENGQTPPADVADAAPAPANPVANADDAAASVWPHDASDLPVDAAVRYGRLANGMRFAILQNDTPSQTAAIRFRFDVGSLNEADDQRGLAHFLEHMAFNGSENVPEGEMVRILERAGLAFGPDTNAYTTFDETVYQLDLPEVDEETLDTAFFLMRETADALLLDAEAIDRERGVVQSELRISNTYGRRYTEAQWAFLYPSLRFPQRFPIGLFEVLDTAPRERLADLYDTYYAPERGLFVFVGGVDPDAVEARIHDTFSDWERANNDRVAPDPGAVAERSVEAGFFYDPDMPTVITISSVRPAVVEPDSVDARRRNLLRSIGESIVSRRLQTLSRDPEAVFLQASAGFTSYFDVADTAFVQVVSRPDDWRAALGVGEQELRRALEFGFTQSELNEQIANIRTSLENAADQADTRENAALSNAIAGAFSSENVFTSPAGNLERFESYASLITTEDVWLALRDAWDDAEPLLYLATNEEIADAPALVLAAYEESRAVAVEAREETGALAFAYESFGEPGDVVERGRVEDLDITTVRFANNVMLNVKATDFEEERVRVSVRIGGGLLELPVDQPGLNLLVSNALVGGGLEAHSLDELQRLLAGRTVGLNLNAGADAFSMGATTTPDDLALQMQVFAALITAPGFRPEGLAQFRQLVEVWYETLDATPQGIQQRDVPRLLRSGDARYGLPEREDILARNYEELAIAVARAARQGAIEIGVVGDVDVDAVVASVAATFGALPARNASPLPFSDARALTFAAGAAQPVELRHAGEPDRALALIYWPTVDDSDVHLARTLDLVEEVMDIKLLDRVREADAATYSPNASSFFSGVNPGFGYIGASLDLEPENVERYFGVFDEIAASLASGDISADELDRARRPVLESYEENLEQNEYWLGLITTAQTQPEYLGRHRNVVADYESLTVEELTAAAAAYLRPETAYRVAILPPETG